MTDEDLEIVRRDFQQGKVAYAFQWNKTHHQQLGKSQSDLAALWAHLESVSAGRVPLTPFSDPFYARASSLSLKRMSAPAQVGFRRRMMKSGMISPNIEHDVVNYIREFHRNRGDISYCAGHDIIIDFLYNDPKTIAIEVPVWSEHYELSGHVDLVRYETGIVQVCDYKPGPLESLKKRFLESIPQVAAYGEMMTYHLASTLRSAFDGPQLPKVQCCIFDTHNSWHFGAEMFVTLKASGNLNTR